MDKDAFIFKEKLRFGVCDNCDNPGEEMHPCPYAEDIHGDSNDICNCCDECAHNCAMDI